MSFPPPELWDTLGPDANPNDLGRGPLIIGILWSLTMISAVVVAARIYVRSKIGSLGWDDWFMLMALGFQLVDITFISKAFSYGFGKHDKDLTFNQLIHALKWGWFWMIPGTFVAVLARVSSAIFLNRLFGIRPWFRWYMVTFTALQCAAGSSVLLVSFAGTRPVEALWNPTVKAVKMDSSVATSVAYATQAIFTFADLTYVLFPVIIIWRLQMTFARRMGLMALMCASLLTMVASIMKAITLLPSAAELQEPQYASTMAALWSGVEQTLVIIMASIPPLSAVSKIQLPRFFSRLGSAFSNSFSRFSTGKSSSAGSNKHYQDLDLNALGKTVPSTTTVTHHKEDPTRTLVKSITPSVGVQRIDEFSVTYHREL